MTLEYELQHALKDLADYVYSDCPEIKHEAPYQQDVQDGFIRLRSEIDQLERRCHNEQDLTIKDNLIKELGVKVFHLRYLAGAASITATVEWSDTKTIDKYKLNAAIWKTDNIKIKL